MHKIPIILLTILFITPSCTKEVEAAIPEEETMEVIHPHFNFTADSLAEFLQDSEETSTEKIMEKPQVFLELMYKVLHEDKVLIRLVNKDTGLSAEEAPRDIVALDDYKHFLSLSRSGHRLRSVVMPSLLAMTESARQEGIELMISSTFRDYDYQKMLFDRYVERDGLEAAERYSARPGKSQHQLGTAIDFGSIDDSFAQTEAGKWVNENAWRFGFSLSYPEGMEEYTGYIWESWHYRYIGEWATVLEKEFFNSQQERMLRFFHKKSSLLEAAFIQ